MAEAGNAAPAPKNTNKLFGILFAVLNLAGLGVGAYLVYASTLGVKMPATSDMDAKAEVQKFEESLHGDPVVYTMPTFNTNLDGVPRRLVRVEVNLEMLDEEGFEEVINKSPQAQDSINKILNGKSFNDVETVQGKLALKNQIIADLNGFLDKGVVKNVFFSQFVIQ